MNVLHVSSAHWFNDNSFSFTNPYMYNFYNLIYRPNIVHNKALHLDYTLNNFVSDCSKSSDFYFAYMYVITSRYRKFHGISYLHAWYGTFFYSYHACSIWINDKKGKFMFGRLHHIMYMLLLIQTMWPIKVVWLPSYQWRTFIFLIHTLPKTIETPLTYNSYRTLWINNK